MAKKPTASALDGIVSVRELASAIGRSPRQVRDVLGRGGAELAKGRGYRLADALRALYERAAVRHGDSRRLGAEEARLRAAQANLREFELAQCRGEFVAKDVIDAAGVDAVRALVGGLDAMPARLGDAFDAPQRHRVRRECDRIKDDIAKALEELSQRWASLARAKRSGGS
jgi:phage terminase Nu1 subunit (DNA packaging protein)